MRQTAKSSKGKKKKDAVLYKCREPVEKGGIVAAPACVEMRVSELIPPAAEKGLTRKGKNKGDRTRK